MIPEVEFESVYNIEAQMYWPVAILTWADGSLTVSRKERFEAVREAIARFDALVDAGLV